jgi:predicted transposase/invertase (TIGR01784 family)
MRTLAEIDAWYEEMFTKAKLEGEARGRKLARQEIVLNMLRENIPLETIAEITGLTIDQLEKLSSSPTE